MVEMLEANHAISHATDKSLILLDEIGRGTSTYDGMALAQAIVEYIHDNIHAKTLFSTHYHELTSLENSLDRLKNIHVRAEEYEGNVVFLHQIKEGAADESYGIHVAKLANLPETLIERANHILQQLEGEQKETKAKEELPASDQLSFFVEEKRETSNSRSENNPIDTKLIKQLQELDLFDMTPMDAMNTLYQLQKEAKSTK